MSISNLDNYIGEECKIILYDGTCLQGKLEKTEDVNYLFCIEKGYKSKIRRGHIIEVEPVL